MKKLLLSLTLLVGFAVHAVAETVPTAKAIYCEANTTLYFTYDDEPYNTFTAYEQLDGNTPTAVYTNIRTTGYAKEKGLGGDNLPWNGYLTKITTVKFLENFSGWSPTSLGAFFARMSKLATIEGGEYLNTSNVTSFREIFYQCGSLTNLDFLSQWNTGEVTNLEFAFYECKKLTNINGLKNWNVSNVTTMVYTFYKTAISSVEALKNWNVSSVKNMTGTFYNILSKNFKSLKGLEDWNTSNVEDMSSIFAWDYYLEDISALKNWNVSNVYDLSYAFWGDNFTNVNALSNWDTGNVINMCCAFLQCERLADISGLTNWNTSKVHSAEQLFGECKALTNVDALARWETGNFVHMHRMFSRCTNLENIEGLRDWDTSKARYIFEMFYDDQKLTSIEPIFGWNTGKAEGIGKMFYNCKSLTGRIDLSGWDFSNFYHDTGCMCGEYDPRLTNGNYWACNGLYETFYGCEGIIGITLGKGNIAKEVFPVASSYQNMYYNSFQNCPKLRFIDFSNCTDTYKNIVSVNRSTSNTMFNGVPRTTVIYLPKDNGQPDTETSEVENVVYTASDNTLQCDKYYSEDKVDIELPHRFHADLATYERPFSKTYAGVILPYPVKINDNASDEFQPFILQEEYVEQMFFKGSDNVPANTPFVFKRKGSTDMKFAMEDVWVESTYDVNGETSDNIDPEFKAWKSQGFYVSHEIEPENGKFNIPTMDDYVGTETVAYDPNKVYYIASNKFYRTDPSTLYLDPHRILYYGQWEKFSGDISGARPAAFTIEELDENSPAITAIQEAELRLDESRAAAIYDASGNRLSETKRGVNILRMADGSVKKVLRK